MARAAAATAATTTAGQPIRTPRATPTAPMAASSNQKVCVVNSPAVIQSWNPTTNIPMPPSKAPTAAPTVPKGIARPAISSPTPVSIPVRFSQLTPFCHASNPSVTNRVAPPMVSTTESKSFKFFVNRDAIFHARKAAPAAIAAFLMIVR